MAAPAGTQGILGAVRDCVSHHGCDERKPPRHGDDSSDGE
jgi:hypothetical protein